MSFLTGFATGFAKSVDTQLRESIERTRENIDMVSKWRLKKAEERERQRKTRGKELDDLISFGASVIGDSATNPEAVAMSAELLKERGESGFRSFLTEIDKKKNDSGISPLTFFKRADTDAPMYSKTDYVNAFLNAEDTYATTALTTPVIKGGGLIDFITGGRADPFAMGVEKADIQMKDMGVSTGKVTGPSITFGRTVFDREGYNLGMMNPSERIEWYRNKLLDPTNTEKRISELEEGLNKQIIAAQESNAIADVKSGLEIQLNRMASDDPNRPALINRLNKVGLQLRKNAAIADGSPEQILQVQIDEELLKTNPDMNVVRNLRNKLEDMQKGGPTIDILIKRKEQEIQDKIRNVEGYSGSQQEKDDIATLNDLREQSFMTQPIPQVSTAINDIVSAAKKNLPALGTFGDTLVIDPTTSEITYIGSAEAQKAIQELYQSAHAALSVPGRDNRALDEALEYLLKQVKISPKGAAGEAEATPQQVTPQDLATLSPENSGDVSVFTESIIDQENKGNTVDIDAALSTLEETNPGITEAVKEQIQIVKVLDDQLNAMGENKPNVSPIDKAKIAAISQEVRRQAEADGILGPLTGTVERQNYMNGQTRRITDKLVREYFMEESDARTIAGAISKQIFEGATQKVSTEMQAYSDNELVTIANTHPDKNKQIAAREEIQRRGEEFKPKTADDTVVEIMQRLGLMSKRSENSGE